MKSVEADMDTDTLDAFDLLRSLKHLLSSKFQPKEVPISQAETHSIYLQPPRLLAVPHRGVAATLHEFD